MGPLDSRDAGPLLPHPLVPLSLFDPITLGFVEFSCTRVSLLHLLDDFLRRNFITLIKPSENEEFDALASVKE